MMSKMQKFCTRDNMDMAVHWRRHCNIALLTVAIHTPNRPPGCSHSGKNVHRNQPSCSAPRSMFASTAKEHRLLFRAQEVQNTHFCPGETSYGCFKGRQEYLWRSLKPPYEVSPVKPHLGNFGPPDSNPPSRQRPRPCPAWARSGSGGDKYPILPFPGEMSCLCFTGCQKYF
jgi:hypothetical protein